MDEEEEDEADADAEDDRWALSTREIEAAAASISERC
jgi:hypothetical protein